MNNETSTLTDAEWDVMNVLWDEHPCTAGTIQTALHDTKGWAYSTVKTTLDRMAGKGILVVTRDGKRQLFSPAEERSSTRLHELKRFLTRAFDGAFSPALALLIEEEGLSPDEVKRLQSLIKKAAK